MSATVDKSTKWSRGMDFIFTCAGGAVGLGNVWRFPYVCYKNGGGAFMIPYLIMVFVYGLPMFALESGLGQLTGKDMIRGWNMIPLVKGLGFCTLVIMLYCNTYYAVILAWVFRYLIASFSPTLPWTTCNNTWNTPDCFVQDHNATVDNSTIFNSTSATTPVEEFWEREVLNLSANINDVGVVQWKLLLCLLLMWAVVYFFIWKGFKWTAKAVYFTVPLPFIALIAVLIRGLTLDGSVDGVYYFLKPELAKLKEPGVWINAAEQVCWSYSVCVGCVITLSSHNRKNHNFIRDTTIMIFLNMMTSFVAGFAVFSVLGFMAKTQNTTVDAVVSSGPGLAFLVYPQALSLLPFPQIWSVLFFVMLLFLSVDSQFVFQECISQTVFSFLPQHMQRKKWSKEITFAVPVLVMGLISISMIAENGFYVFEVFQTSGTGWCYIVVGMTQSIAIGWFFGANKFIKAAEIMLGRKSWVLQWCKLCWTIVIPISAPIMIATTLVLTKRLQYSDGTDYEIWAQLLGWFMALSSVVCIPIGAFLIIRNMNGPIKTRIFNAIKPKLKLTVLSNEERSILLGSKNKILEKNKEMNLLDGEHKRTITESV